MKDDGRTFKECLEEYGLKDKKYGRCPV